ncbi:flagellar export protein FliJ [Arthrobacter crystallopoietes BAB-32]|uniref:Flagellar export protein FliJ n=1 Tax=Arthrobacter crystallopoietes BAB-32 TaxID=1246476 RepID=N1UUK1_9MICC|nr:hypothetical protein [Arthrobacter crystallopoietes]EMY34101.1 flagellar export protein FliJ [Arthrobacter crystallopoietes BAB-32]
MSRTFPLAGLLRLRHLQQDSAAGLLASANNRLASTETKRDRAAAELEASTAEATDAATLAAIAASRAASRSLLHDLDALRQQQRRDAERAQAAFNAARAQSIALEKLEARHAASEAFTFLKAEQGALDEMASVARQRRTEGISQ